MLRRILFVNKKKYFLLLCTHTPHHTPTSIKTENIWERKKPNTTISLINVLLITFCVYYQRMKFVQIFSLLRMSWAASRKLKLCFIRWTYLKRLNGSYRNGRTGKFFWTGKQQTHWKPNVCEWFKHSWHPMYPIHA